MLPNYARVSTQLKSLNLAPSSRNEAMNHFMNNGENLDALFYGTGTTDLAQLAEVHLMSCNVQNLYYMCFTLEGDMEHTYHMVIIHQPKSSPPSNIPHPLGKTPQGSAKVAESQDFLALIHHLVPGYPPTQPYCRP
jgi:hypothetical protein